MTKRDPRLKRAMDAMDWFGSNSGWLVQAATKWYGREKGLETFDKLRELDDAREHLRQMYAGRDAPAQRSALIRDVAVLLARHDYRFGMGGRDETKYAFANSYKFEKRAAEVVALTSTERGSRTTSCRFPDCDCLDRGERCEVARALTRPDSTGGAQ